MECLQEHELNIIKTSPVWKNINLLCLDISSIL